MSAFEFFSMGRGETGDPSAVLEATADFVEWKQKALSPFAARLLSKVRKSFSSGDLDKFMGR